MVNWELRDIISGQMLGEKWEKEEEVISWFDIVYSSKPIENDKKIRRQELYSYSPRGNH